MNWANHKLLQRLKVREVTLGSVGRHGNMCGKVHIRRYGNDVLNVVVADVGQQIFHLELPTQDCGIFVGIGIVVVGAAACDNAKWI